MKDSNYENIMVETKEINNEIKEDEFIKVEGLYLGTTTDKSAMGLKITAQKVRTEKISKSNYIDAIAPAKKTLEINDTKIQYGYSITVEKVELAEKETRVYLKVENNGSANFDIYTFSSAIIQGSKQYEENRNYKADYPEVQGTIRKEIKEEGILTFPAIEEGDFKLELKATSDNWEEDIKDFVFDIKNN